MCQVLVNVTNEAGLQTEVKDVGQDGTSPVAYDYDDFGVTKIIREGTFFNEICYTGAIYDVSTGLYYLNARYYDPKNGRFITRDTYRGEINEPDTLHLYAYCANNPINYVDPSGHLRRTIFNKVTTVGIAISAILKLVCGIKGIMAKEALRKQIKYKGRSAILKVSKTKVKKIFGSKVADYTKLAVDIAIIIVQFSLGMAIAQCIDKYVDPKFGYVSGNGYILN